MREERVTILSQTLLSYLSLRRAAERGERNNESSEIRCEVVLSDAALDNFLFRFNIIVHGTNDFIVTSLI